MPVWIEEDNCTGCGLCIKACPYGSIDMEDKTASVNETCTECGACLASCKFEALLSDIEEEPIPDLSAYQGVWVFAEVQDGALARVSLELLGEGARLAGELGQKLCAVLLGDQAHALCAQLSAAGASKIYLAQHEDLAQYSTLAYTRVLADLIKAHNPSVVLVGATPLGRDLAPRLSRRLDLGLTADCTVLGIDAETGNLLQTRPAFGGNVMATIFTPRVRPQMATVRPGVMALPETDTGNQAKIISYDFQPDNEDVLVRLISFQKEAQKAVDLSEAKIIVAGGRGCGSQEGFDLLKKLADLLGAELGGTRVAVEEGWIPADRQIGQTGQSVRPELYIAVGVSGAIQHRAGCAGARYIVAINRQKEAPIFKVADYAIEGDLFQVVPAMISALQGGGNHE